MKQLFFVLICLNAFGVLGQDTNKVLDINPPHTPPLELVLKSPTPTAYLEIGIGVGYAKFRDYATSPLIYSGYPGQLSLAFKMDQAKKETYFGLQYSVGYYSVIVGSSYTRSLAHKLDLFYQHLRILTRISTEKWNYKIGGQANITGNYRYNPSLQNNSEGFEMVNTLFVSGKVTRDVSRTRTKEKKLWFIQWTKEPRTRKLSFQLNMSLINNSLRNGYAYIDQSSVLNDPKAFGGYKYSWFTGSRMSTTIDYTILLHNENAVQISYLWDAYTTGGDASRFEYGTHFLKFSLLFNTH